MKLWIDDTTPPFIEGYCWIKSLKNAKESIILRENLKGLTWCYGNGEKENIQPFSFINIKFEWFLPFTNWLRETDRIYSTVTHH